MCAYMKKRPDNNKHIKKPGKLIGTKAICELMTKRCDKSHEHSVIEGSMKVADKSVKVSVWAGGYTQESAKELLEGVEAHFSCTRNYPAEVYPQPTGMPRSVGPSSSGTVPEESMIRPDVDEDMNNDIDNWSEEEIME